jgi:hypothetical protein
MSVITNDDDDDDDDDDTVQAGNVHGTSMKLIHFSWILK